MDYRLNINKFTHTASLFAHYYAWNTKQKNDSHRVNEFLLEPKWKSEFEIRERETLTLDYVYGYAFPKATQLNNQYTLSSYQSILKGNIALSNERFHRSSLNYRKFEGFDGAILTGRMMYTRKVTAIRNEVVFEDGNYYSMPMMTDHPETNWSLYGSYSERLYRFRLGLTVQFGGYKYAQTLNQLLSNNRRNHQQVTASVQTAHKTWPTVKLAYSKGFNQFKGTTSSNLFNNKWETSVDYRIVPSLGIVADYTYLNSRNKQNKAGSSSQLLNAAIDYQEQKSAWGFRIGVNNMLNSKSKTQNSISDFMISEEITYILPNIWMLSVRYKL